MSSLAGLVDKGLVAADWAEALATVEPAIEAMGRFLRAELAAACDIAPGPDAVVFLEQCLERSAVAVITNNDPRVVGLVLDRDRPGLTDRLAAVLGRVDDRLDDLKPPYWARRESDDYVVALRALGRVLDKGAKALSSPPITPAEGDAFEAQLSRASRAERKGIKKLLKSIGAIPTAPGRGGGDEEPAGSDDQAA